MKHLLYFILAVLIVDLASPEAIAKYVKGYLFDVLKDVGDDEYIATYLRNKGYKVEGNIE